MAQPKLQTRLEDYELAKAEYDKVVARNKGKPKSTHEALPGIPEIVGPETLVGRSAVGQKLLAADQDHTINDVRLIDPQTGKATGWRKASEQSELENDWAELG